MKRLITLIGVFGLVACHSSRSGQPTTGSTLQITEDNVVARTDAGSTPSTASAAQPTVGQTDSGVVGNPTIPSGVAPVDGVTPEVQARLLSIARDYRNYQQMSLVPRFAPQLCIAPPARPVEQVSQARSGEHRNKLYYIWSSRLREYLGAIRNEAQPDDQVIVKESFRSVPLTREQMRDRHPERVALDSHGQFYTPGDAMGLFIIYRDTHSPQATDGWVYGTVDTSGRVTSGGSVTQCVGCHQDAPHHGLFGHNLEEISRRIGGTPTGY